MTVGIERIAVYPCTRVVDMGALVRHRGGDVDAVTSDMMINERSYNPPWEDPVTMAVHAAMQVLTDVDRAACKLLLVGSESGPDQEKALSTWVQRYAGLGDDCRNLEVKHACYAGSGAVYLAAAWLCTQPKGTKALVITTDQSREHFGKPYEFVMGAGAAALLLSNDPRFLALDSGWSGFYTYEVADLTRPTSRVEAGHSETSLLSYLDAVDLTFERWCTAAGVSPASPDALREILPFHVYHAPFGGITLRAHRAVFRTLGGFDRAACSADFDARVVPTLRYNRRMGGTYASSVFVSLLGCADAFGDAVSGQRVGIYSYGSGSSAEHYSGVFGAEAPRVAAEAGLDAQLDARIDLGIEGYERAESFRTDTIDQGDFDIPLEGYGPLPSGRRLWFRGMRDYERQYAWSEA